MSLSLPPPSLYTYTHTHTHTHTHTTVLIWSHTNISKLSLATQLNIHLFSIYHTCGAYPLHLRHELCLAPSWRVTSALSLHRDRHEPRISASVCLEGNPLSIISYDLRLGAYNIIILRILVVCWHDQVESDAHAQWSWSMSLRCSSTSCCTVSWL